MYYTYIIVIVTIISVHYLILKFNLQRLYSIYLLIKLMISILEKRPLLTPHRPSPPSPPHPHHPHPSPPSPPHHLTLHHPSPPHPSPPHPSSPLTTLTLTTPRHPRPLLTPHPSPITPVIEPSHLPLTRKRPNR